jgi:hypothetical protein
VAVKSRLRECKLFSSDFIPMRSDSFVSRRVQVAFVTGENDERNAASKEYMMWIKRMRSESRNQARAVQGAKSEKFEYRRDARQADRRRHSQLQGKTRFTNPFVCTHSTEWRSVRSPTFHSLSRLCVYNYLPATRTLIRSTMRGCILSTCPCVCICMYSLASFWQWKNVCFGGSFHLSLS